MIDNALVYKILSKFLIDMDAYAYVKKRKSMQDGWAVFIHVHKQFIDPDHLVSQAR